MSLAAVRGSILSPPCAKEDAGYTDCLLHLLLPAMSDVLGSGGALNLIATPPPPPSSVSAFSSISRCLEKERIGGGGGGNPNGNLAPQKKLEAVGILLFYATNANLRLLELLSRSPHLPNLDVKAPIILISKEEKEKEESGTICWMALYSFFLVKTL